MYTKNGFLKQEIRCKSGVIGLHQVLEFLNSKEVDYIYKPNESEVFHHIIELDEINIVFTFDGYEAGDLLKLLSRRYGK